jgi:hypothetical protein
MFGQAVGRSISDFSNRDKLMPSATLTGQLYKWYEKEFGSATCADILKRFGGGVFYDMRVPWQADLAKEAGVHNKCVELVGKTAAQAAEMLWNTLNKAK